MEINIKVDGQKIIVPTNLKHYAKGSKNFVKFIFNLSSDWNDMTISAQFIQNGKGHTRDFVDNYVYLPTELSVGKCILALRGVSASDVIATTNGLALYIDDNMLIQNVGNEEIDQSLYDELIKKIPVKTSQLQNDSGFVSGSNTGNLGDIAFNNGSDGIEWRSVVNAEEVAY